eukprot:363760-Chlamydomonas_euryale.AAC.8
MLGNPQQDGTLNFGSSWLSSSNPRTLDKAFTPVASFETVCEAIARRGMLFCWHAKVVGMRTSTPGTDGRGGTRPIGNLLACSTARVLPHASRPMAAWRRRQTAHATARNSCARTVS